MTPLWLPDEAIFPLPIADTRAPLSSVTLRFEEADFAGAMKIDGTLAADFPIVALDTGAVRLGFGVAAGAFLGFDPNGSLTFELETFDGLFAFPLDVAWGPVRARLQWAHLSGHFADGVRNDEELRGRRGTFSREWAQLQVAGVWGPATAYVGSRVLLHGEEEVDPVGFQVGAQAEGPWAIAPYAAVDLQIYAEQAWVPGVAGQLGVRAQVHRTRFRLGVAAKAGAEDTGQIYDLEEVYLGLVFGFDRTGLLSDLRKQPAPRDDQAGDIQAGEPGQAPQGDPR